MLLASPRCRLWVVLGQAHEEVRKRHVVDDSTVLGLRPDFLFATIGELPERFLHLPFVATLRDRCTELDELHQRVRSEGINIQTAFVFDLCLEPLLYLRGYIDPRESLRSDGPERLDRKDRVEETAVNRLNRNGRQRNDDVGGTLEGEVLYPLWGGPIVSLPTLPVSDEHFPFTEAVLDLIVEIP
jgi:hypothetical protein